MFVKLSPYLIAMLIGLIIGIERERRSLNQKQTMGVRSFVVVGLLGAIASGIAQPLIALGFVFFAAIAILSGYIRSSLIREDGRLMIGMTTELAAMATFGLGFLTNHEPFLSLALGVMLLFVLHNKTAMHGFIKKNLKPEEIQAAVVLLLLTVGVVPLIPDRTIDPFNIFNPFRLGVIIALIASIQFAGYVALRVFGHPFGMPLAGFLAGIISSTAAFMHYPAQAKETNNVGITAMASFAITASIVKLPLIISVISYKLVMALIAPFAILISVSVLISAILANRVRKTDILTEPKNPLKLKSALKIGVLLTSLLFLVELTQRYLGPAYSNVVSFLGALFELDGVVIAAANMYENKTTTLARSANMAWLAIIASLVTKVFLTIFLGKGSYRRIMLAILSGLLLLAFSILVLMHFLGPAFMPA